MAHATGLISRSFTDEFCVWGDCEDLADHPDHPLCDRHYQHIGMMFIHEHIDVMRAVAGALTTNDMLERLLAEEDPSAKLSRAQAREMERAEREARSVVYYVRVGEFIKIGTTTDVRRRMKELYVVEHGELLAVEPGGLALERERHLQFADERHHRELFEPSDRLLAHITSLQ